MGKRRSVTVWGIRMIVYYDYFPPYKATSLSPAEPAAVDLMEVCVGGVDISEMLTDEQTQRIERAVLETYAE